VPWSADRTCSNVEMTSRRHRCCVGAENRQRLLAAAGDGLLKHRLSLHQTIAYLGNFYAIVTADQSLSIRHSRSVQVTEIVSVSYLVRSVIFRQTRYRRQSDIFRETRF